jgi:hypothetical protein
VAEAVGLLVLAGGVVGVGQTAMKMTPASWQSACTATATPEDEPPVIMMAPSFSIIDLADARAASDLVWVSPVTYSTFLPRMPLPSAPSTRRC